MRIALFAAALLVLVAQPLSAAAPDVDKSVDTYIHTQMEERRIPGLALAVIRNGQTEKISTYGNANIEFSVPVTRTTLFHIASITKEFTSVGVMMLVESGRLKLDDGIGTYLNDLPVKWRVVTVRQLLNHTSGLPDIIDKASEPLASTPGEALRILRDKPMDFSTGSRWAYNQTNYLLLALLIEKVSGHSFEDFCRSRLFVPQKLTTPAFGQQMVINKRASIYTDIDVGTGPPPTVLDHLEIANGKMVPMLYAAGGLDISIEDFARWLIALLDGKLISRSSLEALWTAARLSDGTDFKGYGLGWWLALEGPHPAVGGNGGARAAFAVYLKDGLAVIVLTNLLGADPTSLVDGVAKRYLENPG